MLKFFDFIKISIASSLLVCSGSHVFCVFGFEFKVFNMFSNLCSINYIWWFVGVERFSDYTGYADTFEFDGGHTDRLPV